MNKYKAIIIGAGPSGLSTAINLVNNDIKDILVIEKYQFPRYKCCAGYITSKTKKEYQNLGLDINKCHYSFIENFNIFYKLNKKQTIKNKFLYTNKNIDRIELDNQLYCLAKEKGINIIENVIISKHNVNEKHLTLSNKQQISYDYLIFADGTNSHGNKYQNKNDKKNIAMQLILKTDKKDEIQIHFGITKKGYAWVSTLNGITNIGITDVFNKNTNYQQVFKKFLNKINIKSNLKDLKGSQTPIGIKKPIIASNIYYVGDAVGACDPLTLSGLRYALNTGYYCAKSIKENNNKIYIKYINKLKEKFIIMRLLQQIFYLKPTLFCIFEIGCRFFHKTISIVFNNFFVNKK